MHTLSLPEAEAIPYYLSADLIVSRLFPILLIVVFQLSARMLTAGTVESESVDPLRTEDGFPAQCARSAYADALEIFGILLAFRRPNRCLTICSSPCG